MRRAAAPQPIADLQIEYSLMSRGIEDEILPTARELGIGITAYGVLSRGLITGRAPAPDGDAFDFRNMIPRFQGDNLAHNTALAQALGKVADERGISAAQAALGWVLSRGEDIVPIVGARRPERLMDLIAAINKPLNADALAAIEAAIPKGAAAGDRYPAAQMAFLDSERK